MIVGVNKYKLKTEDAIETRDIDNVAVRDGQINRLEHYQAKTRCSAGAASASCYHFCSKVG